VRVKKGERTNQDRKASSRKTEGMKGMEERIVETQKGIFTGDMIKKLSL
jgi:hypothetical protein